MYAELMYGVTRKSCPINIPGTKMRTDRLFFISNIVVYITLSLFNVLSMAIKFILYLSFKKYVLIQEMVIALLNSKHFKVVP